MNKTKLIIIFVALLSFLFISCSDNGTGSEGKDLCSPKNINGKCEDSNKICNNGICIVKPKECKPECDENHICNKGVCEVRQNECNSGDFKCLNNNTQYQQCNENGKWSEITSCDINQICSTNTKKCEENNTNECTSGQKRCSLDKTKIETCSSDGLTWESTDCDMGKTCKTDNGETKCMATEITCTPNEKICDGYTAYKQCNNDGNAYLETVNCPSSQGSGELMQCYNGICKDECTIAAEKRSYMGCEYYAVDLDNGKGIFRNDESQTPHYFSIIVSNPSTSTASVIITDNNGYSVSRDVAPNAIEIFEMDTLTYLGTHTDSGRTFHEWKDNHQIIATAKGSNYSYNIKSNLPIIAYQFSPLGGSSNYSNDASMLIPITAYDKEYRMMSWEHWKDDFSATMTIIAKEDNTEVNVNFSAPTRAATDIPEQATGNNYSVTLSKGETIQFASKSGDLSSSFISANKEIGVFGGHSCTNIPNDKAACDHIEEQLFPINTWGSHYIIVKTKVRGSEADYYKIVTTEASTHITFNPPITAKISNGSTVTLPGTTIRDAGTVTTFSTKDSFELISSKPLSIGQFIVSQQAVSINPLDNPTGDPAFIMQVPVEQYRDNYLFLVPDTYAENYVTIVASPTTEGNPPIVNLDNTAISSGDFIAIGNYYYTIKPLSSGTHSINSVNHIGISVYGYDQYVSYGYPGGLDLRNIKGY